MLASMDNYLYVSSSAHARPFPPYGSITWCALLCPRSPHWAFLEKETHELLHVFI